MIRVTIYTRNGGCTGFVSEGHAGYAAEDEEDILCAAVSVLTINTANAIECLAGDRVEDSEEDGYLMCRFPDGLTEKGKLLLDAMVLGLTQISSRYGEHLRVITKEE